MKAKQYGDMITSYSYGWHVTSCSNPNPSNQCPGEFTVYYCNNYIVAKGVTRKWLFYATLFICLHSKAKHATVSSQPQTKHTPGYFTSMS